jgi:hypothetical protein
MSILETTPSPLNEEEALEVMVEEITEEGEQQEEPPEEESPPVEESPPEPESPPAIEQVLEGSCGSVSGRSTLIYAIGRRESDGSLHLRLVRNSGGGMFCRDWASSHAIDAVVTDKEALTSQSLAELHPGKSINTWGFILAVLKDLGLVALSATNRRFHSHVPGTSCESVLLARMERASLVPDPPSQGTRRGRKKTAMGGPL